MIRRLTNLAQRVTRGRPAVGQTPVDVVHHENKWRLLRYRSDVRTMPTPILMVPSPINRHYILDLMPKKSMVEYLLAQGHDVFILDWGTPGPEDQYLSFDQMVDRYVGRAIRRSCEAAGVPQVHLLGYCLGGTIAMIHGAVYPERVASLLALAAPVDFDGDGLLSVWSRLESLDLEVMIDAFGNMPWPLMQFGFHLLRPTLTLQKLVYAIDRAWDDEFLDGFFALETWGNDNVSFPGRVFLTYIREFYQRNALVRDDFSLSGKPVRLANIEFPVLAVIFQHDNIVPEASATPLAGLVSSANARTLSLRGGHVGAVVSRKASERLWPVVSEWFAQPNSVTVPQVTVPPVTG